MDKFTKKKGANSGELFSPPVILREPSNSQIVLGNKIALRVMAKGTPIPSYQWFLNGQRINGANSDRLNILKSRKEHQGSYTCEVKNSVGKIMSKSAMVTFFLDTKIELVLEPKSAAKDEGDFLTFELTTNSKKINPKDLIWKFNGRIISGLSGFSLDIRKLTKNHHGEYLVEFIDSGKTYTSNSASLVINAIKEKTKQIKKEKTKQIVKEKTKQIKKEKTKQIKIEEPYFFNPEDDE